MPLLALVVTKFSLIRPTNAAVAPSAAWSARSAAGQGAQTLFYARIPLNSSGAEGTHTGFRSLALVGNDSAFKGIIDRNRAKLAALAAVEFKDTTVSDLDKPDAVEAKRAQLLADFNRALGGSVIQELYIAEWPRLKP